MSRATLPVFVAFASVASILAGCAVPHMGSSAPVGSAVCVLVGTEGNEGVSGIVRFTQGDGHVVVEARIFGLTPGSHGFHVHQFGDITASDGTSTGGHFNPMGHMHSAPDAETRHVGDLGNIVANADGVARYRRMDQFISLDPSSAAFIVGRGIIVHAGEDDLTSQPTGAAGSRLASGVIGVGSN